MQFTPFVWDQSGNHVPVSIEPMTKQDAVQTNFLPKWQTSWTSDFLQNTESSSARAIYTMDVDTDTVIVGTTKVHVKATPIQHLTQQAAVASDENTRVVAPRGVNHEEAMNSLKRANNDDSRRKRWIAGDLSSSKRPERSTGLAVVPRIMQ